MESLTRGQKRLLAAALIDKAGTLIEYWHEQVESGYHADLTDAGIDRESAAEQLAKWLRRLPGDSWHASLPDPMVVDPAMREARSR